MGVVFSHHFSGRSDRAVLIFENDPKSHSPNVGVGNEENKTTLSLG